MVSIVAASGAVRWSRSVTRLLKVMKMSLFINVHFITKQPQLLTEAELGGKRYNINFTRD